MPSERLAQVELPLIKENITEEALDQHTGNQHILVIEDNAELREFIIQSLQQNYRVTGCTNGLEGWEYAVENLPDLIISDVTMPIMDGNEVCKRIKSEERTNHIPVVMLTAMASHIHQVEGLEAGADVYITKPFSIQVLELNIRNLLLAKEVLRAKYHKQLLLTPSKVEGQSPEEKFLSKLMQIVEDKMEDPEFNVSALVTEIGMSQTVLYKKIKVITDLSITDFIKSVRLKRAAQLLKDGHTAIAEVAYAVGFNDRKYFSKEFKKQFGVVPSDYASTSDES
ncbi:MAG: response regulator [Pedobacter sp.]|nr:MAG: response regulator [Pedobacter sp.]